MLPKQSVSYAQLRGEGFTKRQIAAMFASLKLFPTPFKGIYYVPLEEERRGGFIEKPRPALTQAVALFLGTPRFYYSCSTAEEQQGMRWAPSGSVHIVNEGRSGRINLKERAERNQKKKSYRAQKLARLLSLYGSEIVFHKVRGISASKVAQTPYGSYALKPQIRADEKRFREKPAA